MKNISVKEKQQQAAKAQALEVIEQIDAILKSCRKLSRNKKSDLWVALSTYIQPVKNQKVKQLVNEIIDIIHFDLYGYITGDLESLRKRVESRREDEILGAEILEVSK